MANEIKAAFDAVYPDGPASDPQQPSKSEIRNIVGGTIQAQFDRAISLAAVSTQWKAPVLVASTANVDIATALESGDVLDGVTLAISDRVLLKNQTSASQNGIYVVPALGAASRATDANEETEIVGMAVFVRAGTSNAGKQYACTTPAPITVGTTALTFQEVSDQSALNASINDLETNVDGLNDLVKGGDAPSVVAAFTDKYGFLAGRVMSDGALLTQLFDITGIEYPGFVIVDRKGFVVARFSPDGSTIIGLSEDEGGQPSSIEPYFAPKFVGWDDEPSSIYLARLFGAVADGDRCRLTVLGETGHQDSGDVSVSVLTDKLGATADLIARPRDWDGATRAILNLTVATAPNPPPTTTSPVIATFGDSITQASAAALIKSNLEGRGYTPSFVGTRTLAGVNSEGRSGWEIGDMTYAVTDKVTPVTDAEFPAYLAMSEDDKLDRNPFIRPSTGGDAAQDIVNGYVMDFTRYQTQSSQAAPTIICIGDGTNDVRDRAPDEIYNTTYAGDLLRYRRMHAAWPTAKILRWFPIVPRDPNRDVLWPAYVSMFRGAMDAIADYANANVILVPLWCCSNSDGGFHTVVVTPDATTGVELTTLDDAIHPTGGTRAEMFRVLSAYIAAAARGLI